MGLPPAERLYRAFSERDESFDGTFLAGVRTTGVFCRPGCGARTPRPENVQFFRDAAAALRAGFRPCLRCRPLEPAGATPAWVRPALGLVERRLREHSGRVQDSELRAAGIEPARAARWFKEHFGMTFQQFQRARRVGTAARELARGVPVAHAAQASGFESESGFRAAFHELFGAAPTRLPSGSAPLAVHWVPTPLGALFAAARDEGVCFLEFVDRRALAAQVNALRRRVPGPLVPGDHPHLAQLRAELTRYFAGQLREFETPVHAPGSAFEERVWAELRRIPYGETRSYAELARALGRPSAVRAVAAANGRNRVAILIPCHRVIGADGTLVGYAGGVGRKERLLELEQR